MVNTFRRVSSCSDPVSFFEGFDFKSEFSQTPEVYCSCAKPKYTNLALRRAIGTSIAWPLGQSLACERPHTSVDKIGLVKPLEGHSV